MNSIVNSLLQILCLARSLSKLAVYKGYYFIVSLWLMTSSLKKCTNRFSWKLIFNISEDGTCNNLDLSLQIICVMNWIIPNLYIWCVQWLTPYIYVWSVYCVCNDLPPISTYGVCIAPLDSLWLELYRWRSPSSFPGLWCMFQMLIQLSFLYFSRPSASWKWGSTEQTEHEIDLSIIILYSLCQT